MQAVWIEHYAFGNDILYVFAMVHDLQYLDAQSARMLYHDLGFLIENVLVKYFKIY